MRKLLWLLTLLGCASDRSAPPPPPAPPTQPATSLALATPAASADASASAAPALPDVTTDGVSAEQARACAAGDAAVCTTIARSLAPQGAYRAHLSKQEADRREQLTTRYALRACELGSGEGCALAGHFGEYSELDSRLARACELGFVTACGTLGARQFYSDRSLAQRRQSAALVERACLANLQDSSAFTSEPGGFCHTLFEWYQRRELPKDRAAQARFLQLACQQGYGLDCPCKGDDDCHPDHFCGNQGCAVISTH